MDSREVCGDTAGCNEAWPRFLTEASSLPSSVEETERETERERDGVTVVRTQHRERVRYETWARELDRKPTGPWKGSVPTLPVEESRIVLEKGRGSYAERLTSHPAYCLSRLSCCSFILRTTR